MEIGHECAESLPSSSLQLQTQIPRFATSWWPNSKCEKDLHATITSFARFAIDKVSSTTSGVLIQFQVFPGASGLVGPSLRVRRICWKL